MNVMTIDDCALVLVDYQGRLMPAIHEAEAVAARAVLLAQAAQILDVPVIGTEQNPQALGPNVEKVRALCAQTLAKTHFDACADGLLDLLSPYPRIVVAGCEAHVCMLQTVLGLLRAGKEVWVVENACGSRRPADHAAAMRRLASAGANIVTHEMVVFEWLHDCKHARFKDALALVKAAG